MDRNILNFKNKIPMQLPDDLLVLANTYFLSNLNYVAISRQEHLAKMMENWPLLAELAQIYSKESNQSKI